MPLTQREYDEEELRVLEQRYWDGERAWSVGRVTDPQGHARHQRELQAEIERLKRRLTQSEEQ